MAAPSSRRDGNITFAQRRRSTRWRPRPSARVEAYRLEQKAKAEEREEKRKQKAAKERQRKQEAEERRRKLKALS